jgi:hypothetical protein
VTNQLALVIGVLLAAGIGADLMANDGAVLLFLERKFLDLVEWVVFWR